MPRLPSQLTYNDLNGEEAKEILVERFRHLLDSQPIFQRHLTLPMAKITLDVGIAVDMYIGGSVPVESPPERLDIAGALTLMNEVGAAGASVDAFNQRSEAKVSAVINAAPIPGGQPPDQIREAHDLPVPRPSVGDRETGRHLFVGDVAAPVTPFNTSEQEGSNTGGREGVVADGYVFSSQPVHPQSKTPTTQHIPVDRGAIDVDFSGKALNHDSGIQVTAGTHYASKKDQGDQKGERYGSVNGVQDLGPAGLMTGRMDRSRISFGNSHRG